MKTKLGIDGSSTSPQESTHAFFTKTLPSLPALGQFCFVLGTGSVSNYLKHFGWCALKALYAGMQLISWAANCSTDHSKALLHSLGCNRLCTGLIGHLECTKHFSSLGWSYTYSVVHFRGLQGKMCQQAVVITAGTHHRHNPV